MAFILLLLISKLIVSFLLSLFFCPLLMRMLINVHLQSIIRSPIDINAISVVVIVAAAIIIAVVIIVVTLCLLRMLTFSCDMLDIFTDSIHKYEAFFKAFKIRCKICHSLMMFHMIYAKMLMSFGCYTI